MQYKYAKIVFSIIKGSKLPVSEAYKDYKERCHSIKTNIPRIIIVLLHY